MSVEEYNEKLIVIKKFNTYLEKILIKSYDNDFEELETLSSFLNLYLNKEKIEQTSEESEYHEYEHEHEHEQEEQENNNEQNKTETEEDDGISTFTENFIKRSQIIGGDILTSAAEFINETTHDLSKINLYNKFREPIERMKKFLDSNDVFI